MKNYPLPRSGRICMTEGKALAPRPSVLLWLVLALGGLALSACVSDENPDERGYIVSVGQKVPNFSIHYLDGSRELLSAHEGKVIMLQFAASWCSVCQAITPRIEGEIWQSYKDNPNFVLLGIDFKESEDVVRQFIKDTALNYPFTLDPDGSRFALFCSPDAGVTRNIIVDKSGKIAMLTRLYDEAEFAEMKNIINKLLTE